MRSFGDGGVKGNRLSSWWVVEGKIEVKEMVTPQGKACIRAPSLD
jgi:hypothetical protein